MDPLPSPICETDRSSPLAFALLFPPHAARHGSGSFSEFGFSSGILRKASAHCPPAVPACPSPRALSWHHHSEFTLGNLASPRGASPGKTVSQGALVSPGQRVRTICPWIVTPGKNVTKTEHCRETFVPEATPSEETVGACHKITLFFLP